MSMENLYKLLELGKVPDSSYTNVGGFLYSLAGDEIIEEKKIHLKFTILKVVNLRIIKTQLEILN